MKVSIFLPILFVILAGQQSCYKISQEIPIPKPEPDFYFHEETYQAPCEIFFENRSYYGVEFQWDFGDGRYYSGTDQSFYFADAGTFQVTLTAFNADGQSASITKSIEIGLNDSVPDRHPWDGYWEVAAIEETEMKQTTAAEMDGYTANGTEDLPDLAFFEPNGWNSPVLTRNSIFNPDNFQSSEIHYAEAAYMAFAFANEGLTDVQINFPITVTVDGEYLTQWTYPAPFAAGNFQIFYDIYLGNLSPGQHTVTIRLDPLGQIEEANESNNIYTHTFEVLDVIAFNQFLFMKNRYALGFHDGSTAYGEMYYTDDQMHLDNFGKITVRNVTESTMEIEFDGIIYLLEKPEPAIQDSDLVLQLTNGVWKHVNVDGVETGKEWMFSNYGYFVEFNAGEHAITTWNYMNDTELGIGDAGLVYTIESISFTRLVLLDGSGNQYVMISENE